MLQGDGRYLHAGGNANPAGSAVQIGEGDLAGEGQSERFQLNRHIALMMVEIFKPYPLAARQRWSFS